MADLPQQVREMQAQLQLTQNQAGVMAQTIQDLQNTVRELKNKTTDGGKMKFIDMKAFAPGTFSGLRNEQWNPFAKKMKNYLNGIADGMRDALNWAEKERQVIS